jgi:hypothetical protein
MSITIALGPHKNPRIDALSDAQRLQWILEFIRRDLDGIRVDNLKAMGDDLLHAAAPWVVDNFGGTAEWWQGGHPCTEGMPVAQVHALQQEIREGIYAVLGESVPLTETMIRLSRGQKPPRAWALPASTSYLIHGRFDRVGRYHRIVCVAEPTDIRTAILVGVANLLIEFGDRLRTCEVCGAPFLRRYRQAYCTTRCSVKVRNKRRLDRKSHQRKRENLGVTGVADAASLTTA